MNSRERVLAALKHQEPDRLPLDLGSFASTIETVPYNNLKNYLGVESKTIAFVKDHIEPDEEILKKQLTELYDWTIIVKSYQLKNRFNRKYYSVVYLSTPSSPFGR